MDAMTKYTEAVARVRAAQADMKLVMKGAFQDGATAVFEAFPELNSFTWHQYTPYFNDGDACTFGTSVNYCVLNYGDDEDENEAVRADREEYYRQGDTSVRAKAHAAVTQFLQCFDDDTLEAMFGDHAEITVKRDGTTDVDSYDHD